LSQHYQQRLTLPEPKVRLPDLFDGSRSTLRGFINQISMVITRKPRTYATDSEKVMLVGDLLTGNALLWFSPIFERRDPLLQDFVRFIDALRARFEDPNKAVTAARRLEALRQGRRPVAAYASEFQLLVTDSGWDGY
ncbi:DUF4939 domain-containing protein, partial [Bacillus sp. SRB_8]|uniref:DUF4939 domain-containing protein n=1 Tax=Bacillus sp. SRB_8 TaxID=1969377 RepID=UPI0015EB2F4B